MDPILPRLPRSRLRRSLASSKVISDYVPTKAAPAARMGLLGVTCVTLAGLFALNTRGEGVTKAAKRLWKAPEKN